MSQYPIITVLSSSHEQIEDYISHHFQTPYLVVVEDGGDGDVALQFAAHRPQQQNWEDGVHAGHDGIATHLVYVVYIVVDLVVLKFTSSSCRSP